MTDAHAEFLQDPEAHAAHLDTCVECRALIARLDEPVSHESVRLGELPLAGWEGASYRSWGFVAACSAILFVAAVVLCNLAGVSPLHVLSMDASFAQWRTLLTVLTGTVRRATLGWQIVFGIAFVAVNTILFVLLRKPPRGLDA